MGAPSAAAGVRLEVGGEVRAEGERLAVRVELTNRGDAAARALEVEGELLGARDQASLEEPLLPAGTRGLTLRFPLEVPVPGVHALALHLRYRPEAAPAGAEATSQRAYLLLALGASPAPPVRLSVPQGRLVHYAVIEVGLESADGAPHRIRLRALTPRGLNALEPEAPVAVPASGRVSARLRVLRSGAPRGVRAGLVVLAETVQAPVQQTSAATSEVDVLLDQPWLPRLRAPLLTAALLLLAAAVVIELRRMWAGRPA